MEFRRTIILSMVMHATLFTAAMTFIAGRGAAVRVHLPVVYVTLIAEDGSSPARSRAVREVARLEKVKAPALPASSRHEPTQKLAARGSVPAVKGTVSTADEKNRPSEKGAGLFEAGQPQGVNVIAAGLTGVVSSGAAPGEGGSTPFGGQPASSAVDSRGTGGYTDAVAIIRESLERALTYPPLARKRKQEGTVVTEFSINARGLPENIRVVKSSGFEILDASAKNTIVKASPFPVVKGNIEVPITYRLEKGE
jgi:protein TonB